MLGIDDLAFLFHTPTRVADDIRNFVAAARSVNPDVDVIVGEVTQTWLPGAVELNALLPGVVSQLDNDQSRVVLAETADGFSRSPRHLRPQPRERARRGRGSLRPSRTRSRRRTSALRTRGRFRRSLSGRASRCGCAARSRRQGRAQVDESPGADSYRVLIRRPGHGKRWKKAATTSRRHVTLRGLPTGERVQLVVLPRKGRDLAELDVRSNRVSLRP